MQQLLWWRSHRYMLKKQWMKMSLHLQRQRRCGPAAPCLFLLIGTHLCFCVNLCKSCSDHGTASGISFPNAYFFLVLYKLASQELFGKDAFWGLTFLLIVSLQWQYSCVSLFSKEPFLMGGTHGWACIVTAAVAACLDNAILGIKDREQCHALNLLTDGSEHQWYTRSK